MKYVLLTLLALLAFACVTTDSTTGVEDTTTTTPSQTDGATVVVTQPDLTSPLVSFKGVTFKTSRR